MKILVTGATGFLGSHLVPYLLAQEHEVACLSRQASNAFEGLSIRTWTVDQNGAGFREAVSAFLPDVVVHLAAHYVSEHRYEDVGALVKSNVEFGAYLLDAMREAGCGALVYAGTSWQHYRNQGYCPVNLYAATKQAFSTLAEYYLSSTGLRLLELHLYESYGEGDPRLKLLNLLKLYAESNDILDMSGGEQRIHLVHVDDLCKGFKIACARVSELAKGERRIYRLPSARAVTIKELVDSFNALNPDNPVRVRWGARSYREREIFRPWEEAECLPGWRPAIELSDGLRRLRQAATNNSD
ncbi:NAD-dependent epimerase/dehydratase family protein [Methylomarinum vadi]|uniref:NAD-dependent epimerase/dehydratase family protein n=1 Tax=Methylomarinum vadi TaxID=438855 RepID=UPI0004DF925F|nr:NAD(P)-dependent oxidoreductase [Methylomarinum vadi]